METIKTTTQSGTAVELTPVVVPAYGPAPCYPVVFVDVPSLRRSFSTYQYGLGGKTREGFALPDGVRDNDLVVTITQDVWKEALRAAIVAANQQRELDGSPQIEDVDQSVAKSIVQRADQSGWKRVETPETYQCWECGYETRDASEIHNGSMSCCKCG